MNIEISKIEDKIEKLSNAEQLEELKLELDTKRTELNLILENKINGMILRSKVEKVEFDEKNSKYFANVEKKGLKLKL